MDNGIIIPTLTPSKALSARRVQIFPAKYAPAPAAIYSTSPVNARVRVRISLHNAGKKKLVMMMKSAGMLTISWTMMPLMSEKCSLMTPRAGAIAAPAMTVRREMERMVNVSTPEFLRFINVNIINCKSETYGSAKPRRTGTCKAVSRRKITKKSVQTFSSDNEFLYSEGDFP